MASSEARSSQVPLIVQTFFWTRTSAFLKKEWHKNRHYENACLMFEKVVVLNELHGQSAAFCEAIGQLDKWHLVTCALPHLIHCCSIALHCRDKLRGCGSTPRMPPAIDKLFNALHWCLVDAPRQFGPPPGSTEIFPVDCIQLFVSSFCPVVDRLRHVDLLNLAPGIGLWSRLMEFDQPEVDCFAALVKSPFSACSTPHQKTSLHGGPSRHLGQEQHDDDSLDSNNSDDAFGGHHRSSSYERMVSSFEKDSILRTFSAGVSKAEKRKTTKYPTFFDIAVIRCIFNPNWAEKGVVWALKYLHNRFSEIRDLESCGKSRRATRSLSTPVPIIKVSIDVEDEEFGRGDKLCDIPENLAEGEEADRASEAEKNTVEVNGDSTLDSGSDNLATNDREMSVGSGSSENLSCKKLSRQDNFELRENGVNWESLDDESNATDGEKEKLTKSDINLEAEYSLHRKLLPSPGALVNHNSETLGGELKEPTPDKFVSTPNFHNPTEQSGGESEESSKSEFISHLTSQFNSNFRARTNTNISTIEAAGSTHYINEDGTFNYAVVLKALYVLSNRSPSQAVIELILPLLETLMAINAVCGLLARNEKTPVEPDDDDLDGTPSSTNSHPAPAGKAGSGPKKGAAKERLLSPQGMVLSMLTRLVRDVGCFRSIACDLRKPSFSMTARGQALNCLGKLHSLNQAQFGKSLCYFAAKHDLIEVTDFLHVLLGSCQAANYPLPEPWKKLHEDPSGGYANKFRVNVEESMEADIECAIVSSLFNTVVSRIVNCSSAAAAAAVFDPTSRHYMRLLMQYVRENHGHVFRLVAFSGMLHSIMPSYGTADVIRASFISSRPPMSEVAHLFEDSPEATGSLASETDEASRAANKKAKKASQGSNSGEADGDSGDSASASMNLPTRNMGRRKVIFHKASDAGLSLSLVVVPPGGGGGLNKDKQKFLSKLRNKLRRDVSNNNDSEKDDSRDLDDIDTSCLDASDSVLSDRVSVKENCKPVNGRAIAMGMRRLAYLMDCCHPGNIPDPPFIAAALRLKSPVVARAAMYAECALLVQRCTRGEWPEWIKTSAPSGAPHSSFKRGLSRRGDYGSHSRINDYYINATKLFFLWGEAIARHLDEILKQEAAANTGPQCPFIQDESQRMELRKEDEQENFLQDLSLNPMGDGSPYALKMMACLVLTEITVFMREVYQNLPKGRGGGGGGGAGGAVRTRDTDSDVTLTTGDRSDALRRGSSKDDSSQTTLDSAALGDRKISFAVEDEDSNTMSSHSAISVADMKGQGSSVVDKPSTGSERGSVLRSRKVSVPVKRSPAATADPPKLLRRHGASGGSFRHAMRRRSSMHVGSGGSRRNAASTGGGGGGDDDDSTSQVSSEEKEADMDYDFAKTVPWVGVVVKLVNSCNFECNHQAFCHVNCYQRRTRSCQRLVRALRTIYGEALNDLENSFNNLLANSAAAGPATNTLANRRENSGGTLPRAANISTMNSFNNATLNKNSVVSLVEKTSLFDSNPLENRNGTSSPNDEDAIANENTLMTSFLKKRAMSMMHLPFVIICKTAAILPRQTFMVVIPPAWQLLLDSNLQLVASAAAVFLVAGVKNHDAIYDLLKSQLCSDDTSIRIQAILRFGVLWKYRYQVWPQLEENASQTIKVPPPSIDFTQPSPQFGSAQLNVVDPPWSPHQRDKTEEAISEDKTRQRSFTTAAGATTRSSQREEHTKKIRMAEEEKIREGREKFHISQVPITHDASYEHNQNQPSNEQDPDTGDADGTGGSDYGSAAAHHNVMQSIPLFPSAVCAAVVDIILLSEDREVSTSDGLSVREVALSVIKTCLNEDTGLFLRFFLERLTVPSKHEELLCLLRTLISVVADLPPQCAQALFNYLTGLIMYFIRNPSRYSQQATATTLSVLWMIVKSVRGLTFKDLKQTLKKEQCDPALLVTAIIPCAKKLVVVGGDSTDMPIPFNVSDDLLFDTILTDSIQCFRIDPGPNQEAVLVDKSGWIMSRNMLVRDYYSNRRGGISELHMDVIDSTEKFNRLHAQTFASKLSEIGRLLITTNLLRFAQESQLEAQVNFVHTELNRLPSFPRKSLEFDLPVQRGSKVSDHLMGIDAVQKQMWVNLLSTLFDRMPSDFAWGSVDMMKFMTVLNGAVLIHCDETGVLRHTLATYLNAAIHFNQSMLLKGYQHMMPTLISVYRQCRLDSIVCKAIEFTVKQFYILHRKPFILQFMGSISHSIFMDFSTEREGCRTSATKDEIPSSVLFHLLHCLEDDIQDPLDILDLVHGPKPLKNLDFCYRDEPNSLTVLEVIQLCVLTVGYAPDSIRAKQMLRILEALTPHYILHIRDTTKLMKNTSGAAKAESLVIGQLGACVRGLAAVCESYASGGTKTDLVPNSGRKNSSLLVHSHQGKPMARPNQSGAGKSMLGKPGPMMGGKPISGMWEPHRADLRIMPMTMIKRHKYRLFLGEDEQSYDDFREPRSSLLSLATLCHTMCSSRLAELRRMLAEDSQKGLSVPDIIDAKTHARLVEVALCMLKVAPHDQLTMGSYGLQKYMTELVPATDWSSESHRASLNLLLKRLEKLFTKITKKQPIRRDIDWDFASNLVKGIYLTLMKQPFIAHSPYLKSLVTVVLSLILDDGSSPGGSEGMAILQLSAPLLGRMITTPPPAFIWAVVRLSSLQMHILKSDYPLEQILGPHPIICGQEKAENIFINLLIPLFIIMGSRRHDSPVMRQEDVSFACQCVLNTLLPANSLHGVAGLTSGHVEAPSPSGLYLVPKTVNNSPTPPHTHAAIASGALFDSFYEAGFLALKFLIVCFPNQLKREWFSIAAALKELGSTLQSGLALWDFLQFIIEQNNILFQILKPFIQFKMCRMVCATEQEIMYQFYIAHNIANPKPAKICKGSLLENLSNEYRGFKARNTTSSATKDRLKAVTRFYEENYRPSKSSSVQNSLKLPSEGQGNKGGEREVPSTAWNRRLKRGGTIAASHIAGTLSSFRHSKKAHHQHSEDDSRSSFKQRSDNDMGVIRSTIKAARGERRSRYQSKAKDSVTSEAIPLQSTSFDNDQARGSMETGMDEEPSAGKRRWSLAVRRISEQFVHRKQYNQVPESDHLVDEQHDEMDISLPIMESVVNPMPPSPHRVNEEPPEPPVIEPDDSSISERRPHPLPRFVLPSERSTIMDSLIAGPSTSQTAGGSPVASPTKRHSTTESIFTIEDVENYSEDAPALPPRPVMRLLQGCRGVGPAAAALAARRRSSAESVNTNRLAPLQHLESLEEWSSAESMSMSPARASINSGRPNSRPVSVVIEMDGGQEGNSTLV